MLLSEKDITPEKIKATVEVMELLKSLDPAKLETLEILLDKGQVTLLEESLESYKAGEQTYPIESILEE